MSMLTIDSACYTGCEVCVESCPRQLVEMNPSNSTPFISPANESNCVFCGHCEAICSEGALKHQSTSLLTPALYGGKSLLSAKDAGIYFRSRRSVRHFLPNLVDKKVIEEIMDVVRYAPTGLNRQPVQWIVVSGKEKIAEISALVIDWMRAVMLTDNPMKEMLGMARLIKSYENGNDPINRSAPHLFIPYCHSQILSGRNDSIIAASHLDLILPSFGLGGCWAGYLMIALSYSPEVQKSVGLPENHTAMAALMVGKAKYNFVKTPDRNKLSINWVE